MDPFDEFFGAMRQSMQASMSRAFQMADDMFPRPFPTSSSFSSFGKPLMDSKAPPTNSRRVEHRIMNSEGNCIMKKEAFYTDDYSGGQVAWLNKHSRGSRNVPVVYKCNGRIEQVTNGDRNNIAALPHDGDRQERRALSSTRSGRAQRALPFSTRQLKRGETKALSNTAEGHRSGDDVIALPPSNPPESGVRGPDASQEAWTLSPAPTLQRGGSFSLASSGGYRSSEPLADQGGGKKQYGMYELGEGWFEVSEPMVGFCSIKGKHLVVEGSRSRFYALVYRPWAARKGTPSAEGSAANLNGIREKCRCGTFQFHIDVKAVKYVGTLHPRHIAMVIVGIKSSRNFYALVMDADHKNWALVHVQGSRCKVLEEKEDKRIRKNQFMTVVITSQRGVVDIYAQSRCIFSNRSMAKSALTEDDSRSKPGEESSDTFVCRVGVAASHSKMVFRNASLSHSVGEMKRYPPPTQQDQSTDVECEEPQPEMDDEQTETIPHECSQVAESVRENAGNDRKLDSNEDTKVEMQHMGAKQDSLRNPLEEKERFTDDDPAIIESVERDMMFDTRGKGSLVTFEDIAALEGAKQTLNEAVVLPLLAPELFTGIREPWKGVLLFGPPGTGKTMLAKAVAGMNETVFFNVSASSLISKWRGESEKLLRCLFAMGRHYSPSIIFIDEIDALASQRGASSEHEASRRLKSELLTQMDGIVTALTETNKAVVVLAATNHPWDLDDALRRRLEKRIYVPLPDERARKDMMKLNLRDVKLSDDVDISHWASETEGYSGDDIRILCREASMAPMRRLLASKSPQEISAMRAKHGTLQLDEMTNKDVRDAFESIKPSVSDKDLENFQQWAQQFGSE